MARSLPKISVRSVVVCLPVSRWDGVVEWYTRVLGCKLVHVDASVGEVVELRFGLQHFSLMLDWIDPAFPREAHQRSPSLILVVPSRSAAHKALAARGGKPTLTPMGFLRVVDPQGNEIFLQESKRLRGPAFDANAGLAYLAACDAWRDRHAAQMKVEGIAHFDSPEAMRAFRKRHGLQPPKPQRAKASGR